MNKNNQPTLFSNIILFDLDGTLIDSMDAIIESFVTAFEHFGEKAPDDSLIKAQIGYPLEDMFASLGVYKEGISKYVEIYKQHYRKINQQKTTLLPNAKEAIELASSFAHLGVVTTLGSPSATKLLGHMGSLSYFDTLIAREDVTNPKPHPEPILSALKQLPKVTGTIWMLGDTCMDADSASAAGINSVAVLSGYGSQKDLQLCSKNITPDALEAVKFIKSL